jgi:predicted dehydrogenase
VSALTPIRIGMLGHGFMGRAHAAALNRLGELEGPVAELHAIAGRNREALQRARARLGFAHAVCDWRQLIADQRIDLFANVGPNDLHAEPTIAAAAAGKHLLCEKPLGRDAEESFEMARAAAAAGVVHMCGFNYRFLPAVRLARELLEAGELGAIRHFRGSYLQDWASDPGANGWRFDRSRAGSGALGDLGSHVLDLGRYLLGAEVTAVSGKLTTFVGSRDGAAVDVDDAFEATVELDGGVVGTVAASRLCPGRANQLHFEINGERGTLAFDLERLNELEFHRTGGQPRAEGFRRILVTGPGAPFGDLWWPAGHVIGWEHSFVHQAIHLMRAIREGEGVRPHGADFEDGYRVAEVCEAISRSAQTGIRQELSYRSP